VTSELATLRLDYAVRKGVLHDGNITRYPESHFLDFVVNGRSLRSLSRTAGPDLVTELNRAWLPSVANAVDALLGRRPSEELAAGRISLLACAECGDLGCGRLTTALDVGNTEVTWSDFLWEDGMSEPRPVGQLRERLTFDRKSYEAVFDDAYERVAGFPYDQLTHEGRRFLWPWQWGWKLPRS
jgi:hypothetical protein